MKKLLLFLIALFGVLLIAAQFRPTVTAKTPAVVVNSVSAQAVKAAPVKVVLQPVTDKKISLAERIKVIRQVASENGVPAQLLLAICFVEGWDRFTGERCQNWYQNGTIVTSATGALCAFQVAPRWHPESDANRLKSDFLYCVQEAARILVASGGKKSPTDPAAWEINVRRYGDNTLESYWSSVKSYLDHPVW